MVCYAGNTKIWLLSLVHDLIIGHRRVCKALISEIRNVVPQLNSPSSSLSVEPVHDGAAPVFVVGAVGAEVDAAREPDRRAGLDVARRGAQDLSLSLCNSDVYG